MNNKIIVIGIIFTLLFIINLTFNNSHASLNALYQVPIILVNNQNISTPNPFQQMIQLNESNYKGYIIYNRSFANFEFVYNNGTVIPAWIENNNSGKLIIWLKINSIPASSSKTIYLDIFPGNDNLLNASGKNGIGEAPELSPTYGEYDDGASVFNFYDNFAGTTLSSKWVANGASYTINNGLTYNMGNNYDTLLSAISFISPYVIDYFGKGIEYSSQVDEGVYFNVQGISANSNGNLWAQRNINSSGGVDAFYVYTSGGFAEEASWPYSIDGNMHIYTLIDGPNNNPLITQTNYSTKETFTSMPSTYSSGTFGPRASIGTIYWQWIRVRAYPPNGVMPKLVFGSLSSITGISKSEEMNIHTKIYALNLTLPQTWGIYGFFNYTIYGKNYSISISNLTNSYYLNLSINYSFSIFNNTTLSYNLSLYAYKLQDYVAINHLNYKGRLNVTITQREYNLSLNDSIIKFENVNNFYYFWNQYGYKVIGSILIIGLFLFFISRLRRMR